MVFRHKYFLYFLVAAMALRTTTANAPAFSFPPAAQLANQKNTGCNEIAAQHLTSIPPAGWPMMGNAATDAYAFYHFLENSIINPSAHDKRKRAFNILANAEQKKIQTDPTYQWPLEKIVEPLTWQDLNLLVGSKDNPTISLASILSKGRTHTEMGKAYLCGLLARPTLDTKELAARQAFIKKLVEDDTLRLQLDKYLQELAASETLLTGLWDTDLLMQFVGGDYSKLSGISAFINESPACLELKSLLKLGGLGAGATIVAITPAVLGTYGLSMLFTGKPMLQNMSSYCFGQLGLLFEAFPALKNRWTQGVLALGIGAVAALAVKQSLQGIHSFVLMDDLLRKRFVHIATYDQTAQEIAIHMLRHGGTTGKSLTFFNDIVKFFTDDVTSTPQLAELEELLRCDTFEKGSDQGNHYLFSRGNVLAAYYLLTQVKEKFEALMAGIGELDALLTAAKLIKESADSNAQWCFATYETNAAAPHVALTDVWNPFIDPATVVTNSLALGEKELTANMVVTGPNSSGKSTALKSVALSILLAQSLGIAPAASMSLTPFAYVVTYMNVADSLVDKESRFQAEARRVFEYGDKVEQLAQENKFSFAIFDEIFSGTSPQEGADLGFKVASIFGTYANSMSVIATHFERLTQLEKTTGGRFINFKIGVEQLRDGSIRFNEQGKIMRTYKLDKGVSHQHIAREVFKERGDDTRSKFFNKCFTDVQ